MTKSELIEKIARQLPNLTIKDVDRIVKTIFDRLTQALSEGDRIEIRGFGSFSIRNRKPRIAVNPRNRKRVQIAAKNIVHFKTGKELHSKLNP